jgi:hypothetical protein
VAGGLGSSAYADDDNREGVASSSECAIISGRRAGSLTGARLPERAARPAAHRTAACIAGQAKVAGLSRWHCLAALERKGHSIFKFSAEVFPRLEVSSYWTI